MTHRVHGKLLGLKHNQIKRLNNLYRRKLPPEAPVTLEFAKALAEISLDIDKSVSTLVDRRGRVITVAVGDAEEIPIPKWHGEKEARLYGLRLIHSHLKPKGLSSSDLSILFLNRLDAMLAVEIKLNSANRPEIGFVHLAQIAPLTAKEEDWIIEKPLSVSEVENLNILEMTRALEQELARSKNLREVKSAGSEQAILIGLNTGEPVAESDVRLAELAELALTAGAVVVYQSKQQRSQPDPRTLIGRGKLKELLSKAYHEDANLLIFDRELNPAQLREIEKETNLKVLDRTQLILDIFAKHAKGREAQVQVELAQLHYQVTRLIGRGQVLSRLAGGIGTLGPGETKLEIDRRRIRKRIGFLENEVDNISSHRARARKSRTKSAVPVVALVGYTNAGKSTLFNVLTKSSTKKKVLSADKLFATLRPTTREGWLPNVGERGGKIIYTDTVGFISDLPKELINAFRATLEELNDADILLHVVDSSSLEANNKISAVNKILDDLNIQVPALVVFNKCDIAKVDMLSEFEKQYQAIAISALTGRGLEKLKDLLAEKIKFMK